MVPVMVWKDLSAYRSRLFDLLSGPIIPIMVTIPTSPEIRTAHRVKPGSLTRKNCEMKIILTRAKIGRKGASGQILPKRIPDTRERNRGKRGGYTGLKRVPAISPLF